MAQHAGCHKRHHEASALAKGSLIAQLCQMERKAGYLESRPSNSASLATNKCQGMILDH